MARSSNGNCDVDQAFVKNLRGEIPSGADVVRAQVFEIFHSPIWFKRQQIFGPIHASADREHLRTDGAGASDVERSVADDEHFFTGKFPAEQRFAAPFCNGRDLVALRGIIGKSAGLKLFPEIEPAQLDLRAKPDVAGEQPHGRFLR